MAIIPAATDLTRPYWDNARDGKLVIQRCNNCASDWHPPLPGCPHCHSTDLGWQQVSGTGTVYTYTVVRHATHAALAGRIPYVIAIVELTEGPRIVTGITAATRRRQGRDGGPGPLRSRHRRSDAPVLRARLVKLSPGGRRRLNCRA